MNETKLTINKNSPEYKTGWKDAKEDRGSAISGLFFGVTLIAGIFWALFSVATYGWIGEVEYYRGTQNVKVRAAQLGLGAWKVDNYSGDTEFFWVINDKLYEYDYRLPDAEQGQVFEALGTRSLYVRPVKPTTE